MSCDIHMQVEEQFDGEWLYAPYPEEEVYSMRNYFLFGLLAGVKGTERFFYPKGFPLDSSVEVANMYEYDKENFHTPNFLTFPEILRQDWHKTIIETVDGEDFEFTFAQKCPEFWIKTVPLLAQMGESRIVFWFDNAL